MNKSITRWYKKVWITRGARFNAHSRLEKHASLSNLTVSILTVYIIGLNLFPRLTYFQNKIHNDDIGNITIILSILILSVSQYISSKEYRLKALNFHNCGKDLSVIYEQLALYVDEVEVPTGDDIKDVVKKYNEIIDSYEENHSKIDMDIFFCDNIKDFPSIKCPILFVVKTKFLYFLKELFLYYFSIIIPLILLFLWFAF